MAFLRRLRAASVLALAWAVLWAPFGAAMYVLLIAWVVDFSLSRRDALYGAAGGTAAGAVWGVVSGTIFAAALAAVERSGGIERLARRRVISWGALSGAVFPVVLGATVASITGSVRGVSAILSLLAVVGAGALYGALVAGGLLAAASGAAPTEGA